MQPQLIELGTVDTPTDGFYPIVVAAIPDFDGGNAVCHVFVAGSKLVEFLAEPGVVSDKWDFRFVPLHTTVERDTAMNVARQVGGITEDQMAAWQAVIGSDELESMVFNDIGENSDEHAMSDWLEDVITKVAERLVLE